VRQIDARLMRQQLLLQLAHRALPLEQVTNEKQR
jgi:hypothetical protein